MKPTCYEHTEADYIYKISLTRNGWMVLRNPVDYPNLPPMTEQLTQHGWFGILNTELDPAYFNGIDGHETALANAQAN